MPSIKPLWPRRGLYAITPDESDTGRLVARVVPVLEAGAAVLQYRNKSADAALRREQALAMQSLCRRHRVPLIVNDDWRLAADIGADGAHLGGDDGDLRDARAAMGDAAVLGASCYDDLDRAREAVDNGVDYIAFGAFFPSGTKPNARRATPQLLHDSADFGVPRGAIGGITPTNAPLLIDAGADLIAVIGGLFDSPDPYAAARAYIDCFEDLT
ncbi:thiamine phosphate synthase [Lysobacter sp. TY2-98]|uniref:thiamine phosphate synthase n=1 Tax=Lysobacter sp. TY2-98 TaxID=2290922 RepID=UPI000E2059CB|nr:thiamine phosphate synthase [Lysobacter sp. TY2-98]AXK72621.1 thiamine phosphate synthase [Lysobacter sp. TY2-98]